MNWRALFGAKDSPAALNLPHGSATAVNAAAAVRRAANGDAVIPNRTLHFGGHVWTQGSPDSAKGTARFVREVAVEGRAVETELEVHVHDLEPQPDGTVRLRGR